MAQEPWVDPFGEREAADCEAQLLEPSKPKPDAWSVRLAAQEAANLRQVREVAAKLAALPPEKPAGPPGFELWEEAAIWAPLPPPDWLMEGLLIRGSLSMIVAYGSSLKTWLGVDACLAAALGQQWLGVACGQGSSCFIDFESGDYELRRRLQRLAKGRGWDGKAPIPGFTFTSMPLWCLADEAFFQAIEPLAKQFRFIAIDSLSAGSGGMDEKDARFAHPLNRLKALAARTGCVILIIHHTRKSSAEGKGDEREGVRGNSGIFNAVDSCFSITRSDDRIMVLRQIKMRGGVAAEALSIAIEDALDGTVLRTGEVMEEPEPETGVSLKQAKGALIQLIGRERDLKSKNNVFRRMHGRRKTVMDALEETMEEGLIVSHEGCYRLASEVQK
jgi:hypothetical protein